jgi:hypothetical protein
MDPTETAEAVMVRHHPYRLLSVVGILRCTEGCGAWPCEHWLIADGQRRWHDVQDSIARITDMLGLPPDPVRDGAPNRGHWGPS